MALKKVAPAAIWPTQKKGAGRAFYAIAYDAVNDVYFIDDSERADAHVVYDSTSSQWYIDTDRNASTRRARIIKVAATAGRIIETT